MNLFLISQLPIINSVWEVYIFSSEFHNNGFVQHWGGGGGGNQSELENRAPKTKLFLIKHLNSYEFLECY